MPTYFFTPLVESRVLVLTPPLQLLVQKLTLFRHNHCFVRRTVHCVVPKISEVLGIFVAVLRCASHIEPMRSVVHRVG